MKGIEEIFTAQQVIKQARRKPAELEALVKRAQQFDQQAIDTLCADYRGMIRKYCAKAAVRTILGYEDAVQSGYVYFLTVVQTYKGNRFDILPGLFYLCVARGLYKEIQTWMGYTNGLVYLDEKYGTEEELSYEDVLADPRNLLNVEKPMLEQLLSQLSDIEQRVVWGIFYEDKTLEKLSVELQLSPRGVHYHKEQAIKKLTILLLGLKPRRGLKVDKSRLANCFEDKLSVE